MRVFAGLVLLAMAGCGDRAAVPVVEPPAVSSEAMVASPAAQSAPTLPQAVAAPVAAPMVVMDVMKAVGRPEDGISDLLGPPDACEDIHRARLCRYPPHGNEVMFVAGKADMITVHNMGAVAFDEGALAALGLEPAQPDDSSERAIRWTSLADLEEVTVFAGDGGYVRYAYVKVGSH